MTAIEPRQFLRRSGQQQQAAAHQQPGDQGAEQALEQAGVEEWAADKGIGAADELDDLDLRAPVEDGQADGIADDQQHRQGQQARQDQHAPLGQGEQGVQALDPFQIELCQVHIR